MIRRLQVEQLTADRDEWRKVSDGHRQEMGRLIAENEKIHNILTEQIEARKKSFLHSVEQDKEILRSQGELSEQQEISHNFDRMANDYHHEIRQWKDRADRAETALEDIMHADQT